MNRVEDLLAGRVPPTGHARLDGLLDKLTGQVNETLARIVELNQELSEQSRVTSAQEDELRRLSEELDRRETDVSQQLSALRAKETVLEVRATALDAQSREIDQMRAALETREQAMLATEARLQGLEDARRTHDADVEFERAAIEHDREEFARLALELAGKTAALGVREAACKKEEARLRALAEHLRRAEEEQLVTATKMQEHDRQLAQRETAVDGRAAELDARHAAVGAKQRENRERESALADRERRLNEHEARLTDRTTALREREGVLEKLEAEAREKNAAASRRAEECVTALMLVENQKRAWEKAVDEKGAADAVRMRDHEAQLSRAEASIDERELALRRSEEALRTAEAEFEKKQHAVAELEALLVERAIPSPASLPPAGDADAERQCAVDISDFSEEEVADFHARRRIGIRSDAALAAEIRSEREHGKSEKPEKKKGWWF